jgi:hypothetical protein
MTSTFFRINPTHSMVDSLLPSMSSSTHLKYSNFIEEMAQQVVNPKIRNLGHWYDDIDPQLRSQELSKQARKILEDVTGELLSALKKPTSNG